MNRTRTPSGVPTPNPHPRPIRPISDTPDLLDALWDILGAKPVSETIKREKPGGVQRADSVENGPIPPMSMGCTTLPDLRN